MNYLEFFCPDLFIYSNLFNYFYQYGYVLYFCIFRFWIIQHYLCCCSNCSRSCVLLTSFHQCGLWAFVYIIFEHFLPFWHYNISSSRIPYIFPAPGLELAISPSNPSSFNQRMILETEIWAIGVLLRCHFFQALSADKIKEYVCIVTCVYTHIYNNFCV